jgi:hypothetical protein
MILSCLGCEWRDEGGIKRRTELLSDSLKSLIIVDFLIQIFNNDYMC